MRISSRHQVRLFLDANVLISAAWKDGSKVLRLWDYPEVSLETSNYILAECRRNLPLEDQMRRFLRIISAVRVNEHDCQHLASTLPKLPEVELPEKDLPVLAAAIASKAHYLVTGDKRHFGQWYGKKILGLRIESPGAILEMLLSGTLHPTEKL